MRLLYRNVALLCAAQALLYVNNVTLIAINALAGFALATNKALATLPTSSYVVGAALTTLPASFFMQRFGRRAGFTLGAACGLAGSLVCALAVFAGSLPLLCLGTGIVGAYNASAQQYRFAAADMSPAAFKPRAIGLVLAGGIAGGIVGPEASKLTKDALPAEFLGTYLSLMAVALVAMGLLQFLRVPAPAPEETRGGGRPLGALARQPGFAVAVLTATVGFGVMNLLMTVTPLAMAHHDHPYAQAAFIIEWHVVAMFAPGFLTGHLIRRWGVPAVMLAGVVVMFGCVAVALAGTSVVHFWVALVLLGAGWNLMYVGATALLTETYRPEEKAKVQGFNDFCVFATMAVTSFSSGVLLHATGWRLLNYLAVPFLVMVGVSILLLARARRPGAEGGMAGRPAESVASRR